MKQLPKKQRLEDAAARLFWQKGYTATSIADIAKEADVPLGNVYYYFKTKAALAYAVATMFVTSTKQALETIEKQHPQQQASVKMRVDAFFALLEQSHPSRAKSGCPIAKAITDFAATAPDAAQKAAEALSLLMMFLNRELVRGGHSNGLSAAQGALAHWQGAIVLAHGMQNPQILKQICSQNHHQLIRELSQ